jgi:hypothetical protein
VPNTNLLRQYAAARKFRQTCRLIIVQALAKIAKRSWNTNVAGLGEIKFKFRSQSRRGSPVGVNGGSFARG